MVIDEKLAVKPQGIGTLDSHHRVAVYLIIWIYTQTLKYLYLWIRLQRIQQSVKVYLAKKKCQGLIDILFFFSYINTEVYHLGFFFYYVSAIYEETFGFSFWDITKYIFNVLYRFCMSDISAYKNKVAHARYLGEGRRLI